MERTRRSGPFACHRVEIQAGDGSVEMIEGHDTPRDECGDEGDLDGGPKWLLGDPPAQAGHPLRQNGTDQHGVDDGEGISKAPLTKSEDEERDCPEQDGAPGRERLEKNLLEEMKSKLSIYKCPRRFVYLDDMPRTATGKLQRFRLRRIAANALGMGTG